MLPTQFLCLAQDQVVGMDNQLEHVMVVKTKLARVNESNQKVEHFKWNTLQIDFLDTGNAINSLCTVPGCLHFTR